MSARAPTDPVERLVFRHLTDSSVFERGQRPERVKVDKTEIDMLRAAGRWLRMGIARLEITVESNPSSNLLIGDFVDSSVHPAFRLQPLRGREPRGGAAVLMSVNDDDPLTRGDSAATSLRARVHYKPSPARSAARRSARSRAPFFPTCSDHRAA